MYLCARLAAVMSKRTAKTRFNSATGKVWASLAPTGAVRTLATPMAPTAGMKINPAQPLPQASGDGAWR